MPWFEKAAFVVKADHPTTWWASHTQAPAPILVAGGHRIRVFVGAYAATGTPRIGYIDLDALDPTRVLSVSERPVLDLGAPGTFDDNGVFPATTFRHPDGRIFLYYTGFQQATLVRYTMFGGLAISEDDGETFTRASQVPVTDRSDEGLLFRGGPCVLFEDGVFLTYYSAGSTWADVGGKLRPCYDIYGTQSLDGRSFPSHGRRLLTYDAAAGEHGIGRPQVIRYGARYLMFFCVRKLDMRYSMGMAVSEDGANWTRRDDLLGIKHSSSGWDSQMVYFPYALAVGRRLLLFYCGNDYGRDGLGYAEATAELAE